MWGNWFAYWGFGTMLVSAGLLLGGFRRSQWEQYYVYAFFIGMSWSMLGTAPTMQN